MASIRPTAEHRKGLKTIYELYGKQNFLLREVKDRISNKTFRKLCDYKFIIKDGKYKLVTPSLTSKRENVHFVNIYRLNLNNELVRDSVDYDYMGDGNASYSFNG